MKSKGITKKEKVRRLAAQYPRVIEWDDRDGVFIGSAPPLVGQCCHGDSEAEVAVLLAAIVADAAEDVIDGKITPPEPPPEKNFSGKFIVRIPPGLHKKAALQAMARGESLNQFVSAAIEKAG